jgi:hypothetical protein
MRRHEIARGRDNKAPDAAPEQNVEGEHMTQAATNINSEDQAGVIDPSGARQTVKPAKKEFRRINRVYVALEKAGLTDAILTIPPRTKIPAIYNPNGSHGPHYKWTTNVLTLQQVKRANFANAGAGIKGKFIGGLDYDGESVELAALIHGLAETYLGLSPIRGRPNSQRFLRPYRYKGDSIKRWSIKFRDQNGAEHTVEFIGDKCFWVAAGTHPSGFDYTYEGGIDLWKYGVENLSQIDQADCDAFQTEIVKEAIALGFELVSNKKSRSSGTRVSIDDPRHWAPTPELAMGLLNGTHSNVLMLRHVRRVCVPTEPGAGLERSAPEGAATASRLVASFSHRSALVACARRSAPHAIYYLCRRSLPALSTQIGYRVAWRAVARRFRSKRLERAGR